MAQKHGDFGDNVIVGTNEDDTIYGLEGNDTLTGGSGADTLYGGGDDDLFIAGYFTGHDGWKDRALRDSFYGDSGFDTVTYASATERAWIDIDPNVNVGWGAAWNDRFYKIEGVVGTDYNDWIYGSRADNTLKGGKGHDNLIGRRGDDTLEGGAGNDNLYGGRGADILTGGEGNDRLYGGDDNDTFIAGDIVGGDLLDGGAGYDIADYSTPGLRIRVGLYEDRGVADGYDEVVSIEEIIGSATGDDIDLTNSGIELVHGGDGADVIHLLGSESVTIYGGAMNDNLWGGDNNDALYGDSGGDIIFGGAGDDIIEGSSGEDYLLGGCNNDTIRGGNEDDQLLGQKGADQLFGGRGDDFLDGGQGDDIVDGGAGRDHIKAFSGHDILTGGLNQDTFEFDDLSTERAHIEITDFTVGFGVNSDRLDFVETRFNGHFDSSRLNYSFDEQGTTLTYDGNANFSLRLIGVGQDDVSSINIMA